MITKLRKMLNSDRAVSPVIAVILMVAITVVLAATVYVWVSGFGSQSGSASKSLSLSSNGAITSSGAQKAYTVASATPGLKWSDLSYTLNGAALDYEETAGDIGAGEFIVSDGGGTQSNPPSTTIDAGDILTINSASISGKTLRVLDSNANSVILTLVVG